jgi:hypothetical protein
MRRHDLVLAQPALSARSHFHWCITLRNPATAIRWTNFVEVMLPCFRADFLRQVVADFAPYISGSGFDWVWPHRAGAHAHRVAILDRVAVTHTRPFGGPNYRFFEGRGYDAADETGHVLRTNGIDSPMTRVLALTPRLGWRIAGEGWLGRLVLRIGYVVLVADAYLRREPNRWKLHSLVRKHFATPATLGDMDGIPDGTRFAAAMARMAAPEP